jgi:hypothetical protein
MKLISFLQTGQMHRIIPTDELGMAGRPFFQVYAGNTKLGLVNELSRP